MSTINARIAFPSNDRTNVESHFGHCREFAICNISDGKLVSTDYVTPPPHAPGVLPKFLAEQKATVIITGGMGAMAVNMFKESGIDVILGAQGSIMDNLTTYLEGELASTGSVCNHDHGDHDHDHGHSCH